MSNSIQNLNVKLTELQENVLCHLAVSNDYQNICKNLNLKAITMSKILSSLREKNLYVNQNITPEGEKMVNYLKFRNQTILSFLNKYNLSKSTEIYNQLRILDFEAIIALKNALV